MYIEPEIRDRGLAHFLLMRYAVHSEQARLLLQDGEGRGLRLLVVRLPIDLVSVKFAF